MLPEHQPYELVGKPIYDVGSKLLGITSPLAPPPPPSDITMIVSRPFIKLSVKWKSCINCAVSNTVFLQCIHIFVSTSSVIHWKQM